MSTVEQSAPPLAAGQKLSRDEFLRRWELQPEVKKAELIGGVVCMPSPVSVAHGSKENFLATLLGHYSWCTPGCEAVSNAPWLMLGDAPQPDSSLRILPEYGGRSRLEGLFGSGAPELVVEVCLSSASHDVGPKLELYRKAGVSEYVAFLIEESRIEWRCLTGGQYARMEPGTDGILRARVFPGLWLDPRALLRNDGPRLLEVLNQGLQSPDHAAFVEALAARRRQTPASSQTEAPTSNRE
ncbi:MAG: Uma2 family endonuclease [Acidobacteria bacterium]|nr:Uma2 family endonuclease [Acidobacteriota bacterium]